VRAEPLRLAEMVAQRMVDVVRVVDGVLLLDADPSWAGAINTVLVKKGARVNELRHVRRPQQTRQQLAATRLYRDDKEKGDHKNLSVKYRRGGVRAS
jgi:hypothetical protein